MSSVLVLRKFDGFSRALFEAGIDVFNLPLIETVETANASQLSTKIATADYDGLFITSARAAEITAREMTESQGFSGVIYVLGSASFEILRDKGLRLSFYNEANTAAEMLSAIPAAEIDNKRFLFVRGDRSIGSIDEFLTGRAALDEIIVYRTATVALSSAERCRVEENNFDVACFFSPSGIDGFIGNFGESRLRSIPTAAIGATTAAHLRDLGSEPRVVAAKSNGDAFAASVIEYLSGV